MSRNWYGESLMSKSRLRSPNYPSMSLPDAIARVKAIYEKELTNVASREVMIKAMGYSGINGASATAFSALTKYNLISSVASDEYKISEDGLNTLLYSRGEPSRLEAIERAAFAPQLFSELREQYPDALPSDENLTANLVKRGFNPKSVAEVIRNYRETIEFVRTEGGSVQSSSTAQPPVIRQDQVSSTDLTNVVSTLPVGRELADSDLTFRISRNLDVAINFNGEVTVEAIEKLISLLNLSKDVYPTKAELETSSKTNVDE